VTELITRVVEQARQYHTLYVDIWRRVSDGVAQFPRPQKNSPRGQKK